MNRHGQRNTLHPYAIHIYNTDRQTIGHRQRIYLQLTRKYDIVIRLVPEHVMSIFRHGYFAVIKLYTKRLKYKTTPFVFNLHFMR